MGDIERKLDYFEPETRADKIVAVCPEEELVENEKSWKNTLVGYTLGRRPNFEYLNKDLPKIWEPRGALEIISRMNGFFLFQFLLGENGSKVLEGGPWLIGGRVLILRKWERGLDVRKDLLQSVPIWVRFPQLGLHLWSSNMIGRIASTIGKPLYMDKQTSTKSRLVFARVCIEVNKAKKLPEKVWIDVGNGSLEEQCVEYEWISLSCTNCKAAGHKAELCPVKVTPTLVPKDSAQSGIST